MRFVRPSSCSMASDRLAPTVTSLGPIVARLAPTVAGLALALLAPPLTGLALAHPGHGGAVAHSHQTASAGGLQAVFHFNAPEHALYSCPMDPEVAAAKPGRCPKCKMDLVRQTHTIGLTLQDASKKAVSGAAVRLRIQDGVGGMKQELPLKGEAFYQGSFVLSPGPHTITALVRPKGAGKEVAISVPYASK